MNITLVEDNPLQQKVIHHWMNEAGYQCQVFSDGNSLMEQFHRSNTDLLLLDWELPDSTGLELLHWLRLHHGDHIPVLFLTMRDSEADVVAALLGGADDYLIKPARRRELLARIEANLRRSMQSARANATPPVQVGPFTIDQQNQQLSMYGEPVDLTQKEFNLANYLLNNLGSVVSRAELLERIWGQPDTRYSRTIDTHISRLRKKMALHPEQGWRLSSIYQSGYRLEQLDN